ncbi:MAG: hypothetical protein IKP40_09020 [Clostridia bacterium]|nr:hypothetical protein [Clostridia bacterium]
MAKGRKNGCPVNVRDWVIEIEDKSQATETFERIHGLESMSRSIDSDTSDGSAATDAWEEPYVTKRSASISLEGKPLVTASTGAQDKGQALLDDYAGEVRCEGDATIRMFDPWGNGLKFDAIVTGTEVSADEDGEEKSWDLEQVGEAEIIPYVAMTGVSFKNGDTAATTLALTMGGTPTVITIVFAPEGASNKRFRISVGNKRVAAVSNVTETSFTVSPISVGTCNIKVTTVNGAYSATLAVTVSAGS